MTNELVSIVVPTFKRADLLPLAVDSALAQTYSNIEVIVSDDEDPSGESWGYLQKRAAEDSRLRPLRNTGRHGEAFNMNNALRHATGGWIKPLHDDDRLLPRCIERFMQYCRGRDHVAMAGCQAILVSGTERTTPGSSGLPPAELIRQKYVHLGMYLVDQTVSGPPTTLFINRRAVEAGGVMVESSPIRYYTDSRWVIEIARHGDSLLIHEPLVEYFQGAHVSLSSSIKENPDQMDAELMELRELIREAIPSDVPAPPLETVKQMMSVIRMISQFKAGRPGQALRRLIKARRPGAWWWALRFTLRRWYPTQFHETPREVAHPVDDSSEIENLCKLSH